MEELTLQSTSLDNVLDWLTLPHGPRLVDEMLAENQLTALAVLVSPEAFDDPGSPLVGLGFVYKAPYIQSTSWSEAYFELKLTSQAEASSHPIETKVIFVQIQVSSQVIPLPSVPTLFLDMKTLEDITDSKVSDPHKTLGASISIGSSLWVRIHRFSRWLFPAFRAVPRSTGFRCRNRYCCQSWRKHLRLLQP